jgi:hypothetical protein
VTSGNGYEITRRQALAGGSALAASAYLLPLSSVARAAVTAYDELPVAYVAGSGHDDALGSISLEDGIDGRHRVIPARKMRRGDASLRETGIRVRVHGLYPTIAAHRYRSIALDHVSPPPVGGRDDLRFYAWTYNGTSKAPNLEFFVPASRERPLRFDVFSRIEGRSGLRTWAASATFTTGTTAGRPRLKRGTYLLGANNIRWPADGSLPAMRTRPLIVVSIQPA